MIILLSSPQTCQTVYEGQELNHAFGLCHYKHFLFWNEYRSGSIYKLDTASGAVALLRNERPPIFEIRMYDAQQQQGERIELNWIGLDWIESNCLSHIGEICIIAVTWSAQRRKNYIN